MLYVQELSTFSSGVTCSQQKFYMRNLHYTYLSMHAFFRIQTDIKWNGTWTRMFVGLKGN